MLATASLAQYAALFCIGMLCYLYRADGYRTPSILPLCGLATATHWIMTNDAFETGVVLLMTLGFVALIHRGRLGLLRNKILLWIGAISYPLYLLHQNIGYVVILRTANSLGLWGSRLLALLLAILLAWLVHEVVELRFSRWAHRKLMRRSTGSAKAG